MVTTPSSMIWKDSILNHKIDFKDIKKNIDLVQYATSMGYIIDKKKSTTSSIALCKDKSDKVIISKKNGIWVYFSVYDDSDNGTIIDFIKNRTDRSIQEIGMELQKWSGLNLPIPQQNSPFLNEKCYKSERIEKLFNHCRIAYKNDYLKGRGLSHQVLHSPRFCGRVFQDDFKNAVFPHFKEGKICGLELKGKGISLFVRGSEKTLWRSNHLMEDDRLIITETPIDAMSYAILHPLGNDFYIATCGGFSQKQVEIVQKFVSEFSWINNIVLATDNDIGGDKIAHRLETIIKESSYTGKVSRHSPTERGCDWNDVLIQLKT